MYHHYAGFSFGALLAFFLFVLPGFPPPNGELLA
jgi:hypothetical protein